ncbi:probable ATP-dependent RNA helicase DDX43 [Copidosoma floridanum]|uniref:probable ATP-dependent RNA helicase DDX43 n=1 Tax=Copidosoma floridanum TaxID=29053 RepID=UPI0006C9B577|nr:probable ATP-dependent RNA helicase DDX43 [Copidosoma floridanum]
MKNCWVNSARQFPSSGYDGDKSKGSYEQGQFRNNGQRNRNTHQNAQENRDSSRNRDKNNSNEEQTTFYVETSKLGRLIGRGGSQIKELQEESRTKINVNKECIRGSKTLITVVGSKDAQCQVKSMIEELLDIKLIEPNEGETGNGGYSNSGYNEGDDSNTASVTGDIDWSTAAKDCEAYLEKKWAAYPAVKKNFYIEDPEVTNMTKEEVDKIRQENNNINVEYTFETDDKTDDDIPNPVQTFEQAFKNYPDIMMEIKKQGFEKPSPIQCQAWPVLLSGKDMIGIAQTGTGKTLAFLLPALIHIDNQDTPRSERCGPTVLVMAPTRELALQIQKEVNKYDYHGIKAVCLYGGGSRKDQVKILSGGVEIVIATPGRLNDLVQSEILDVKCVSYLVLDEADRMLDMGFEPQIRKTLLDVRPDRQSVMTSATWPPGVRRLATSYMKNPVTVCVGSLDLKAVHSVTQKILIVNEEEKTDMLKDFFQNMAPDDKAIIFFGKKAKVDDLGSDLALSGVKCQSIHGGREQCDREQALEDIKSGDVRILLATDVASRGIDIEDITHVFNYDFPRDIEEYVHRVGRTGRAGRTGESISLVTRRDWSLAKDLIKILEEAEQEIPTELYDMAERYEKKKSEDGRDGRRFGGGGGNRGGGGGYRGGGGGNRGRGRGGRGWW